MEVWVGFATADEVEDEVPPGEGGEAEAEDLVGDVVCFRWDFPDFIVPEDDVGDKEDFG